MLKTGSREVPAAWSVTVTCALKLFLGKIQFGIQRLHVNKSQKNAIVQFCVERYFLICAEAQEGTKDALGEQQGFLHSRLHV